MSIIRVMLVEDGLRWRHRVAAAIAQEHDIELIRIAGSIREAVKGGNNEAIDIILLDASLIGCEAGGMAAIREMLARRHSKPRLVVLGCSAADREAVVRAYQYGAVNYVVNPGDPGLVKAIRDAYCGRSEMQADVAELIREALKLMALTPTEREVYQLMTSGFSKRQIAGQLVKSEHTVKTQMRRIREKMM